MKSNQECTLELRLKPEPSSVRLAREALAPLRGEVDGPRLDDAKLLVSELVTNSIRHAGLARTDQIRLRVAAAPERVHVEVVDGGRGLSAQPSVPTPQATSGWGLFLVGKIASRWGVMPGGRGVWFDLDSAG